jgi:hypothetical protein
MDIDLAIVLALALSVAANLQSAAPTLSWRWLSHLSSQEFACAPVEGGCVVAEKPSRWARR